MREKINKYIIINNKFIYLFIILIFALISSFFVNNIENFENIHTLGLDESKFYPEACGSVISFSGSLGCPTLTNNEINTMLSRGNNNNSRI